jgi:dolichol kinase
LTGLFFVGLGDSTAALVGREFGETKWFFGSNKTVEGSLGCLITVFATFMSTIYFFKILPHPISVIVELSFATFASTIFEALTKQFDNLLVPLFYFSMTTLLHNFYHPIFTRV